MTPPDRRSGDGAAARSWLDPIVRFCLEQRLVVLVLLALGVGWGISSAPFDWRLGDMPRDPVPVDAIPDIGENQQIVFTSWPGRSPQDIEDQVTYPLTVSLLGLPGVRTVRSISMFGFSTIYVIFEEDVEFYWSRSRVLEKLSAIPDGTLPEGAVPTLGPDATALGQVFWYTLEGHDPGGAPTGGWDLHELRSIQDWQVRYALLSVPGVAEVASVGGHVQEYQIDVDPAALRAYGVTLADVFRAVRMSNAEVGARTIEINRVEYVIRGVGFLKGLDDLRSTAVRASGGTPVFVKDVASVGLGPALRRGILDKGGAEVVGGVVIVRHGHNPLEAIAAVKEKIAEISPGLPRRTLEDGTTSQMTVVPFYDRTDLIHETLETLNDALVDEVLVTVLVVLVILVHLRSALLVSALLPLAVLFTFIAMRYTGVDANLVSLSGIAIAIGTIVDMGIVVSENIVRHLRETAHVRTAIRQAVREVGGAVVTAVATTVVGFLPVFALTGAEGKLFRPLAFTKTYALVASVLLAVLVLPPLAEVVLSRRGTPRDRRRRLIGRWGLGVSIGIAALLLTRHWLPLGPERAFAVNVAFVVILLGGTLWALLAFQKSYSKILVWCLAHRGAFLGGVVALVLMGTISWLGFDAFFGWLPARVRAARPVSTLVHAFPGMGREFMPPLDEGSYLFMPTTMPHASIGEAYDVLRKQDLLIRDVPEVALAVGKIGRVDSALDPAPISMVETVIEVTPEFLRDDRGRRARFRFDPDSVDHVRDVAGLPLTAPDGEPYLARGAFLRDESGSLVRHARGRPFRLWRPALDAALNPGRRAWRGIREPDDVWEEVVRVTRIPGTTSAPRLQPIAARLVMLQSGMRAPMGIKVRGPDLPTIERFGREIERLLAEVPSIEPATVIADRIVGKPYLEIHPDRLALARYGLHVRDLQDVIEVAIGGKTITRTVEGRERYPVRVRYPRELRGDLDAIGRVLVATPDGTQVPLSELARLELVRGPQMIKSEDTFLTGYVIFDRRPGHAEVDVVDSARSHLERSIASGALVVPAGVSYRFAGSYENQVRAQQTLSVVLPVALAVIFLILYLQFRRVTTALLVFSGVAVAWAGGFVLLWLYGQPWFLDVPIVGSELRDLFGIGTVNLSVAVWVGFLALFGIATDNGVIMGTYLEQTFGRRRPKTQGEIRAAAVEAGTRRVRPCVMTTATTILALVPVLTSTGRGADVMVPMAIPSVGGMLFVLVTTLTVPVIYSWLRERELGGDAR